MKDNPVMKPAATTNYIVIIKMKIYSLESTVSTILHQDFSILNSQIQIKLLYVMKKGQSSGLIYPLVITVDVC